MNSEDFKAIDQKSKQQKAVALSYDQKADLAPKIIAQGKGEIAKKIIAIAKARDIPIKQDQDIAELLSLLDLGSFIPIEAYDSLAEIMTYVYHQKKKNRKNAN